MKKTTIKEIRVWMKTLEENRYRKIVNADARRIAWFVNNSMSENYDDMPESMRKKWVKVEYKKERYMAKKFLESKKQNESVENKVRQIIREEIQKLNELTTIDKWLKTKNKLGPVKLGKKVKNSSGKKGTIADIGYKGRVTVEWDKGGVEYYNKKTIDDWLEPA